MKFSVYRRKIFLFLLLASVFAVFFPALKDGFLDWDDTQYITANPALQGPLSDALTFFPGYYQPLTILTYKIEFLLHGLNPLPFHAANILLHAANCLLFFYLLLALGTEDWPAFIAALLFGIHPVHAEPVAWISGRKELLWGMFFFGTLLAYLKHVSGGGIKYLLLSLLLFVLSVLSKPFGIAALLALPLMDFYFKRVFNRELWLEKIPYFIAAVPLALLSLLPSYFLFKGGMSGFKLTYSTAIFGRNLFFYVQKTAWPSRLSALYPAWAVPAGWLAGYGPFLAAVLALSAALWLARRFRSLYLGGALFFVPVLPALFLSPPADRYVYVPAAGAFFLFGEFYAWIYRRASLILLRRALALLLPLNFILLGMYSAARTGVWKDSLTLWSDALEKYPGEYTAYFGRGNAYSEKGDYDNAAADYTSCLEIAPAYWKALNNRARAYSEKGEYVKAVADYNRALGLNPGDARMYLNRGNVYFLMGDYKNAVEDYDKALLAAPDFAAAAENRGEALRRLQLRGTSYHGAP